jgi:hypothetical protein
MDTAVPFRRKWLLHVASTLRSATRRASLSPPDLRAQLPRARCRTVPLSPVRPARPRTEPNCRRGYAIAAQQRHRSQGAGMRTRSHPADEHLVCSCRFMKRLRDTAEASMCDKNHIQRTSYGCYRSRADVRLRCPSERKNDRTWSTCAWGSLRNTRSSVEA